MSYLQALLAAPLPDWEPVEAQVARLTLEPGQVLFRAGDHHPYIYVLVNGVIKLMVPRPTGEPALASIARAGDLVASLHGLLPQGFPDHYYSDVRTIRVDEAADFDRVDQTAVAATGGTLERVHFSVLLKAMSASGPWGVAGFRALALHTLARERRARDLLYLSAEERYRNFLDTLPELVGVLPQKDIANYIGVTPVGLSRIVHRVRADQR